MNGVCHSDESDLDVISDLPKNITEKILMCLPLQDAARMSILSSKWRYEWITLPHLIFDEDFFDAFAEEQLSISVTTIYQVLLQHKGPILKFTLYDPPLESCSDINHWIRFLSNTHIQDFTLGIFSDDPHKLPSQFYSFLQLRHLNLSNCLFKPPPTFKGFSRLVSLEFHGVALAAEIVGSLISSCPQLEQLTLDDCVTFECLEIDAPKLRFLSFYGTFKDICFKNTPLLVKVSISLVYDSSEKMEYPLAGEISNLMKVVGCLPIIEDLEVYAYFLEFLVAGKIPTKLPITLAHLKFLHLAALCFDKVDMISCALCLIRSSPNLEDLVIVATTIADALMEPSVKFLKGQDKTNCCLNRLRTLEMVLFSGVEPEVEFIKYLLAHATVLETVTIKHFLKNKIPVEPDFIDVDLTMLNELMLLSRASTKVEFIYADDNGALLSISDSCSSP